MKKIKGGSLFFLKDRSPLLLYLAPACRSEAIYVFYSSGNTEEVPQRITGLWGQYTPRNLREGKRLRCLGKTRDYSDYSRSSPGQTAT